MICCNLLRTYIGLGGTRNARILYVEDDQDNIHMWRAAERMQAHLTA